MGETRLGLVIADLVIAGLALWTGAAGANERHRDAVARLPAGHIFADGFNHAREFVSWHMGNMDVRVVAHPAVPVAAAYACGLDFQYRAASGRRGVGGLADLDRSLECLVDRRSHSSTSSL